MAAVFGSFREGQLLSVGRKRLAVEQTVGRGAFGVVYKVREQASGRSYALKDIHCEDTSAIERAIQEVNTLCKVSHDNVLQIVGVDQYNYAGVHFLILTEFCSGGNLNERLSRSSSNETNFKWMTQLASALSHLHDERIVHRDLKPENVLLTDPQTDDIKIGDFGLSREYLALKSVDIDDVLSFYTTYYMNSGVGTVYWMAPEVFSRHYTHEADVFSLGCIFYAILVRRYIDIDGEHYYGAFVSIPGQGEVGLGYAMARQSEKFTVHFPAKSPISTSLRKITIDALQLNPRDRPSARDLCERIMAIRRSVANNVQLSPETVRVHPQPTGGCFC